MRLFLLYTNIFMCEDHINVSNIYIFRLLNSQYGVILFSYLIYCLLCCVVMSTVKQHISYVGSILGKNTINHVKYKISFDKNYTSAEKIVSMKASCQEDRTRWLSDAGPRIPFCKGQKKIDLVMECLGSQKAIEVRAEKIHDTKNYYACR